MNYFGHAAVAIRRGGSPAFVLGAMLPDLMAMARVSGCQFSTPKLAAGVDFHIETDAVFHQTQTFIKLNRCALGDLRQLGVSRGPARACAHMGVEMLIDAKLIEQSLLLRGYLAALDWGANTNGAFAPLGTDEQNQLRGMCAHLLERGAAVHTTGAPRFELRLGRTLQGRRLLEPTSVELRAISDYLSRDANVAPQVPALMDELSGLWDRSGGKSSRLTAQSS